MAKNEVLDEWIEWVKSVFKWSIKTIIALVIIFLLLGLLDSYMRHSLFDCNGNRWSIKWKMKSLIEVIGEEYVKNGKPINFDKIKLPYKLHSCNKKPRAIECIDTSPRDRWKDKYPYTKGEIFFETEQNCFLGIFDCVIGGIYEIHLSNLSKKDSYIVLKVGHQGVNCRATISLDKNVKKGYRYCIECEKNARCSGKAWSGH